MLTTAIKFRRMNPLGILNITSISGSCHKGDFRRLYFLRGLRLKIGEPTRAFYIGLFTAVKRTVEV